MSLLEDRAMIFVPVTVLAQEVAAANHAVERASLIVHKNMLWAPRLRKGSVVDEPGHRAVKLETRL